MVPSKINWLLFQEPTSQTCSTSGKAVTTRPTSMMDPSLRPSQPNRPWRYPGQDLGLIQRNQEEIDSNIRIQSWVHGILADEKSIDRLATQKRQLLPNIRDRSPTQELLTSKQQYLPRRVKKMPRASASEQDRDGDASEAGQENERTSTRNRRGQFGRQRGRPARSRASPATPVASRVRGTWSACRGNAQLASRPDGDEGTDAQNQRGRLGRQRGRPTRSGPSSAAPVTRRFRDTWPVSRGSAQPAASSEEDVGSDELADLSPHRVAGPYEDQSLRNVTVLLPPMTPTQLSPSKRSISPSMKSSRLGTQWITMDDLASYNPAIVFSSYNHVTDEGQITKGVRDLWKDFIAPATSTGPIPLQLQGKNNALLDTPEKSRSPPPPASYTSQPGFSAEELSIMSSTVEDVWKMAEYWGPHNVHKTTWSDLVVSPLLHIPRKLKCSAEGGQLNATIVTLNIRTVEISPESLCPDSEKDALYKKLDRKIDFIMGLGLSSLSRKKIQRGTYRDDDEIPSINQTSGFTRYTPVFLNVEVKKQASGIDPLIQLAVWIAAEYKKRVVEGWDRSMPVTAITVVGHLWELYVVYEPDFKSAELSDMVFIGPINIGSTHDFRGIWSVVHVLIAIAHWGRTMYEEWFRSEILSKL